MTNVNFRNSQIKADYHVHTNFSIDSKTDIEDMIKSAINKGLYEIVFTDHYDIASRANKVLQYKDKDFLQYEKKISSLQKKYQQDIQVKWGIEVGINVEKAEKINTFIQKYPFEFVIASIHDICEQELYIGDFFMGMDKYTAYENYFNAMYEAIKVTDFDVVGHFDYVPRYVPFDDISLDYEDFRPIIDKILSYIIKKGKGLELNMSGYVYGVGHHHPQIDILSAYHRVGGEIITVGSDAHRPEDIARHYDEAKDMLITAGFSGYSRFADRKPYFEAFE